MTTIEKNVEYAPWNDWNPQDYLSEYYAEVMPDERYAIEFLVDSLKKLDSVPVALDFGCGPTVHHSFPLMPKVQEMHMAEYLASNLAEVERWVEGREGAHNWEVFALETLRLEGNSNPTTEEAQQRMELARQRTTRVSPGDAGDTDPQGPDMREYYPLVTSHYCAEGATNDKDTWRLYMRNIASLVAPGGALILSACGAANFYCVGDQKFPCAGVNAQDMLICLSDLGFGNIDLRVRQVPDHSEQGYGSVIFAYATKDARSAK